MAERRPGALGLRDHADQRLLDRARVGQPCERIGGGTVLGDGEVAQVGEHRGGLRDRRRDRLALGLPERALLGDEQRADHLAADERGDAQRAAARPVAQLAALQRLGVGLALVRRPAPDGEAGARGGAGERFAEARDGGGVGARLERVSARVARQHDGGGVGHDPLGAPAQQVLDLELVVGALERLDVLAPLAGALAVAARLALNREHADGQQEDAKPDHEGEHDPARTLEVGLGALLDVALQSAVLGAQLVHERLASARVLDADRPRAAALDLIDRDPRVRLPLARGRGQVAHELQSRSVASGALLGNAVRALELRLPGLVRREEVAVGGQRVAAQARLLVEHRGQQVARGAQLPLIVDHRLALLAGDQPDARADHEDGHRQQHSQSCVNGHTHDLCRPRAEKLESAPCRLSAGA